MSDLRAIFQLGSFDHASCDAALRSAGVRWVGSIRLASGADASILFAMPAALFAAVGFIALSAFAWLAPERDWPAGQEETRTRVRAASILLVPLSVYAVAATANDVATYVSTCRALLHVR